MTTKKKMSIHYDPEGDYLEVRFGKPSPAFFENKGDDIFVRKDRKTNAVMGYAIFNVTKRTLEKHPKDIEVDLPLEISA